MQHQNPDSDGVRDVPVLYFSPKIPILRSIVMKETVHSAAFAQLKPLIDGHLLIAPKRSVVRYSGLTDVERIDLWRLAEVMADAISEYYEYDRATVELIIQDGALAGQTVFHVHIHVIPKLMKVVKEDDERMPRSGEEMAEEAAAIGRFIGGRPQS